MSTKKNVTGWKFVDESGTFTLSDPHQTSSLYFPLVNQAGLMSSITPLLHGDIKTDQNTFLTPPVSVEDLHNTRSARNFWGFVSGSGAWSATGSSAAQIARSFSGDAPERVELEAGFLWHKVSRESSQVGLRAVITNFVPVGDDRLELMRVTLTNATDRTLHITPTAAIPIYGRSADNLRDHRHVTSLLQRVSTHTHGVLVRPTLSFDERGHRSNTITYAVLGTEEDGAPPVGFFPVLEEFIGEGGNLDWPEAVVNPESRPRGVGQSYAGYEAIGGLRFQDLHLGPGASRSYILILSIMDGDEEPDILVDAYGSLTKFETWLERSKSHWQEQLDTLTFHTAERRFDLWMRWVTLQPTLRRLYGNSFLPYHDYGRGGRGWRDLWQDILALLLVEAGDVSELLHGNFAGVRIDGSNATIIGTGHGEFKADRNDIPRVWMDHGAWPLLTTRLYIDQTGDLAFLLRQQTYFKDHLTHRAQAIDELWDPEQGTQLQTSSGEPHKGTILEHLLVQHLTAFFNVGDHNNIRLEGADWNDALDMAPDRGESVAFSALYAANLRQLSHLVLALEGLGITQVSLAVELMPLLDRLTAPIDYASVAAKRKRLADYFASCRHVICGEKVAVALNDLADDLAAKADWLYAHIRENEWIETQDGLAWFNGLYDNDGRRVEGDHPRGVRMTLTGQVFTLMGGIATDAQALRIVQAANRHLYDPDVGGYRLNTDFGEVLLNLGRAFGFAYGHKENGAMFSHMAVMYAYALYRRGLVIQGHKVLDGIYRHCQDFPTSRIYPGIPEYISAKGRGMYPYLTGSASWYLFTMLTEVFGVKGLQGDLVLSPKLIRRQFDASGQASVKTLFGDRRLNIVYHNPRHLDHDEYRITRIEIDDSPISFQHQKGAVVISREAITTLPSQKVHQMDVHLAKR